MPCARPAVDVPPPLVGRVGRKRICSCVDESAPMVCDDIAIRFNWFLPDMQLLKCEFHLTV